MKGAALVQTTTVRDEALAILSRLGVPQSAFAREGVMASSPITGEVITHVVATSPEEASAAIGRAAQRVRRMAHGARRRGAASWCGFWRRNCAPPRPTSAGWSRSRPARSSPRASARSRR